MAAYLARARQYTQAYIIKALKRPMSLVLDCDSAIGAYYRLLRTRRFWPVVAAPQAKSALVRLAKAGKLEDKSFSPSGHSDCPVCRRSCFSMRASMIAAIEGVTGRGLCLDSV